MILISDQAYHLVKMDWLEPWLTITGCDSLATIDQKVLEVHEQAKKKRHVRVRNETFSNSFCFHVVHMFRKVKIGGQRNY